MKLQNKLQKIVGITLVAALLASIALPSMSALATNPHSTTVPNVEYTQEMFELVNMIMAGMASGDSAMYAERYGWEGVSPHFISYTPYQRLATVFNVRDGILNPIDHWTHIRNIGVDARNHANERYPGPANCPERKMPRDRFRHFTWNFRLAAATSSSKARIATNNFDYATLLLPGWQARYDQHMAAWRWWTFVPHHEWHLQGLMIADNYAIAARASIADNAAVSNTNFRLEFGPNNIMDFWNNWKGYSSEGVQNNRAAAQNAFYSAMVRGVIILDETNAQITNDRVTTLRTSGVWRHFR